MNLEDTIKDVNLKGWLVLNLMQWSNDAWRVILQQKTTTGATANVFTDWADGKTPQEAIAAATFNLKERIKHKTPPRQQVPVDTLTADQQNRLGRALDRWCEALDEVE